MICRICMRKYEKLPEITEDIDLRNLVENYLNIDLDIHKELPKTICENCHEKLVNFDQFKQFSLTVQRILVSAMKSNKLHIFTEDYVENMENSNESDEKIVTQSVDEEKSSLNDECEYQTSMDKIFDQDYVDHSTTLHKNSISDSEEKNMTRQVSKDEFECKMCSEEFVTHQDYAEHVYNFHENTVISSDKKLCYVCGNVCDSMENLLKHLKTHMVSSEDDAENSKSKNPGENKTKMVTCTVCSKTMLRTSLRQHMFKHTDRFKCSQCDVRTASRANLLVHFKATHSNVRDHECDQCGKTFTLPSLLKIHKLSHGDARQFKCKQCDYAGKTHSALRTHSTTHVTVKLHICDYCGSWFKTLNYLTRHQRRCKSKKFCTRKIITN